MLYDYGGPWDPVTSIDAPLYKRPSEASEDSEHYQVSWLLFEVESETSLNYFSSTFMTLSSGI